MNRTPAAGARAPAARLLLRASLAVTLAAGTLFYAAPAKASPSDLYGLLPAGTGAAGARIALGRDAGATFYNPANLALAGGDGTASVELGYVTGIPSVFVDREKAEGRFPTRIPERQGWMLGSALIPLGGKIRHQATLGLAVYHPENQLIRVSSIDPRVPQWYRYEANPERPVIVAGLGVKLGDRVALGAAANVLANLDGRVDFGVELFDRKVERRDIDFSLITMLSPIVGATVRATDALTLALVWRGDQKLELTQPNSIDLGDLGVLGFEVLGTVHFSPHQLALGASYEVTERLRLALEFTYSFWSLAPHPGLDLKVNFSGEVAEGLGLDEAMSFGSRDAPVGFSDTFAPSLSGEYRLGREGQVLRAGYTWRPTMVPDQENRTNYLDTTAHVFAAGANLPFHDPLELLERPLHLVLAAQLQYLVPRQTTKLQRADPVGNHRIGGTVLALGASLRYDF